ESLEQLARLDHGIGPARSMKNGAGPSSATQSALGRFEGSSMNEAAIAAMQPRVITTWPWPGATSAVERESVFAARSASAGGGTGSDPPDSKSAGTWDSTARFSGRGPRGQTSQVSWIFTSSRSDSATVGLRLQNGSSSEQTTEALMPSAIDRSTSS